MAARRPASGTGMRTTSVMRRRVAGSIQPVSLQVHSTGTGDRSSVRLRNTLETASRCAPNERAPSSTSSASSSSTAASRRRRSSARLSRRAVPRAARDGSLAAPARVLADRVKGEAGLRRQRAGELGLARAWWPGQHDVDAGLTRRSRGGQHATGQGGDRTEVVEAAPGQAGLAGTADQGGAPVVAAGVVGQHRRGGGPGHRQDGAEAVQVVVLEGDQPAAAQPRAGRQARLHLVEVAAEEGRDRAGCILQHGLHRGAEPGELAVAARAQGQEQDVELDVRQLEFRCGEPCVAFQRFGAGTLTRQGVDRGFEFGHGAAGRGGPEQRRQRVGDRLQQLRGSGAAQRVTKIGAEAPGGGRRHGGQVLGVGKGTIVGLAARRRRRTRDGRHMRML